MEKIRVVIAEDEAIIRLDLRETLENAGYMVLADTGSCLLYTSPSPRDRG